MNDIPADNGNVPATQSQSPAQVFLRELNNHSASWVNLLPAHIDAAKFASVVRTAVLKNRDLLKCDRTSLWQAATAAANAGLMPDGREGAIVPYGNKAAWIPMIAGIRKLARNSGEIHEWSVYCVYENDQFRYELGDDPYIRHRPTLGERGNIVAVYSVATLKSGEKSREIMTAADVEKIRAESKQANGNAWRKFPEEMYRKTVAKRHAKYLPMSTDIEAMLLRGIEAEDADSLPRGDDDPAPQKPPRSARARLEAAAAKPSVIQPPDPPQQPPGWPPEASPTDSIDVPYDVDTGEINQASEADPAVVSPPTPLTDDEKTLLRRLHNSLNSAMSEKGLAKSYNAFVADLANGDKTGPSLREGLRAAIDVVWSAHNARVKGTRSIAETDNAVTGLLR
jgi:phage RecT family recombinase